MPYEKPTLTELISRIRNDIYGNLGLPVQFLRKGFIFALSKTLGGQFNGLYGYLDWILDQPFVDIADDEFVLRWASIKNIARINAEKSQGEVEVTGVVSSTVPEGTQIVRNDGKRYEVTTSTVISANPQLVPIISIDTGTDTVTEAATVMTFVSVPVGVDSEVTVDTNGITGGRDLETIEELRERVLTNFRNPPRGGSDSDHFQWAREAVNTTKQWLRKYDPDPVLNPWGIEKCEVRMYFTMADTYADTIPLAGDVQEVQNYIDERRPAGEIFEAVAPTASSTNFNITILPNDSTTQAAVTAQLTDLIKREQEENGTLLISSVYEALGQTQGLTDWTLNSPTSDIVTGVGEVHSLGTITFS